MDATEPAVSGGNQPAATISSSVADALPSAQSHALALPVLHEVLSALAHSGPVEGTLNLLAEKARLLISCASAAIALLEPDKEFVTFIAAAGQEAPDLLGTKVRLADTVAGQTARTGEPFMAFRPVVGSNANGNPSAPLVESAAVVAIFDEGKPIGAFAALNKSGNLPFDGGDFLALSTLSSAASVVLGNARLRARTKRQSRELSVLYDAVRRVSGQLSVQEVLRAVVEQTTVHLENNGVAIFLTNDERTHLYIAEDDGISEEDREVTLSATTGIGELLLNTTQPLLLDFVESEDEEAPIQETIRAGVLRCEFLLPQRMARSGLVAPVRSGDFTHGFLLVVSQQPFGVYSTADANLLFALASQTAVATETAFLYEDANRRAEEATALYELSQAVTSTLNLNDVLGRVAESVLNLLAVDKFALFLLDRHNDRLQLEVSRGLPEGAEERLQPRVGEGIPGWVMEFETPTAVQDVAADHRNASAPLHMEGVVSATCMPLQVGTATIGVLAAMSSRRRLFTVAEMELLYTIANQAAIAIENARVYADVRRQSIEIRKYFHRVARALGSSHNPGEVPELIVSLTLEIMEADRCALHIVERTSKGGWRRRIAASIGFPVETPTEEPIALLPDTPTGWVAHRMRPLAVEDLREDPRFAGRYDRPVRGEVSSFLGVPLRSGSEVVGVLEVYSRKRRAWQSDETRLLLSFASQATVAFQNARLAAEREQTERINRLLERLLAMSTQTPLPSPEEIIAALALGLNAPVATLQRDETGLWVGGPASIPRDTIPLEALVPVLEGASDTLDIPLCIGPDSTIAITVLTPPEPSNAPMTRSLLELAVRLLEKGVVSRQ